MSATVGNKKKGNGIVKIFLKREIKGIKEKKRARAGLMSVGINLEWWLFSLSVHSTPVRTLALLFFFFHITFFSFFFHSPNLGPHSSTYLYGLARGYGYSSSSLGVYVASVDLAKSAAARLDISCAPQHREPSDRRMVNHYPKLFLQRLGLMRIWNDSRCREG